MLEQDAWPTGEGDELRVRPDAATKVGCPPAGRRAGRRAGYRAGRRRDACDHLGILHPRQYQGGTLPHFELHLTSS